MVDTKDLKSFEAYTLVPVRFRSSAGKILLSPYEMIMDYVTQLIETYPERVFRGVVLLLFTICLLAVMAIIRIPSSISSLNSNMKRLMRVLIRIQTGEPVRSVDAFL